MRCERIQELILTDYIDKALNEKIVREIDAHILSCAACREFKRVAEEKVVQPFKAVQSAQVPSYIWERVKQSIYAQPEPKRHYRILFRPALAFAAVAAMIIAILVARPIAQTRAANEYMAEQIDFMMQVDIVEVNGDGELFY
jgi:predicted anti-sigma-YlaC factor YlaD